MTFIEAIKTCLFDKYATFKGRATRSEFWWFLLTMLPFEMLVRVLVEVLRDGDLVKILLVDGGLNPWLFSSLFMLITLVCILTIIPMVAVTVRRLHDINKSGYWYFLIPVVPVVGSIVVLLLCLKKTYPIDNQYGPVPENK
jgi:uncharacterized membrane protein YhaH (DUF805 family)